MRYITEQDCTKRVGIGSFVTFHGKRMDDAFGRSRSPADAGALAVRPGVGKATFIAVDRVRSNVADGHAISVERSRLPLSPEPEEVPLKDLREGSLQKTLHGAGLVPPHGEEWVDIEMLPPGDAAILACARGSPFLLNPAHFALHPEF